MKFFLVKGPHWGGGMSRNYFWVGILIFYIILEPYVNPFWDISYVVWKKKMNTKNSGLPKLLRWSHALLSDPKMAPMNDAIFTPQEKMLRHFHAAGRLVFCMFPICNLYLPQLKQV